MSQAQPPPNTIATALAAANQSPCAKSKRGVAFFIRNTDITVNASSAFNGPPHSMRCEGNDACKAACNKLAVHAESRAIGRLRLYANSDSSGWRDGCVDLVHVKSVDGKLVPSGGPSCWQCSREVLDCSYVRGVWLYHDTGWRFYPSAEFHYLTLQACDLPCHVDR